MFKEISVYSVVMTKLSRDFGDHTSQRIETLQNSFIKVIETLQNSFIKLKQIATISLGRGQSDFQNCNIILLKMPSFQQKHTRHAKKKQSMAYTQEEKSQ